MCYIYISTNLKTKIWVKMLTYQLCKLCFSYETMEISLSDTTHVFLSFCLLYLIIQVISQLQEKADEYKIPLCFAFVDYEKAFDSIEFNPLFESLENQGVEAAYITLLRDLYNGATPTLKLHRESDKINLQRGVRQGDNISPKLFTACLQDAIINKINWEGKGINIDGEYLSHLIFADDIVLVAKSPQELESMLTDIHLASKPVGLSMNLSKTKVMLNETSITSTVQACHWGK